MQRSKLFSVIIFFLLSFKAFAADLTGVSNLFAQTFWNSHYEERYCGKNIETLVAKAVNARLDLSNAQIIGISDAGGWMAGMVNALQAREAGLLITPSRVSPMRHPGERNWYFHVVLLVEGRVMDYDFTNQPRVIPLNDYLHEMFIPKAKRYDRQYKIRKMQHYKITTYPAEDYILRRHQGLTTQDITREYYLKDVYPQFFQ